MHRKELFVKIGLKIREIRDCKKMSLQELSDIMNIEYNNLIRIEKGRTNPTVATLYKIAQILEVKLTELVDVE